MSQQQRLYVAHDRRRRIDVVSQINHYWKLIAYCIEFHHENFPSQVKGIETFYYISSFHLSISQSMSNKNFSSSHHERLTPMKRNIFDKNSRASKFWIFNKNLLLHTQSTFKNEQPRAQIPIKYWRESMSSSICIIKRRKNFFLVDSIKRKRKESSWLQEKKSDEKFFIISLLPIRHVRVFSSSLIIIVVSHFILHLA